MRCLDKEYKVPEIETEDNDNLETLSSVGINSSSQNEAPLKFQERLDNLWSTLKMPIDQRMNMTVKYALPSHLKQSIVTQEGTWNSQLLADSHTHNVRFVGFPQKYI